MAPQHQSDIPSGLGPQERDFLNLYEKPGRLTSQQTAIYLGFRGSKDIAILVSHGLLKPLANPPEPNNTTKWFALSEIQQLRTDVKWMARATAAIRKTWHNKNRENDNYSQNG